MSTNRTEAPTPRRLAQARARGEVACSRELTGAVALAAGWLAALACGPSLLGELHRLLRQQLSAALSPGRAPSAALYEAAGAVARLSALPCLAALLAALVAGLLQTGGLMAPAAAAPRLERLDPGRGLARLVSLDRLAATGLGLLKAAAVAGLAYHWAHGAAPALAALPRSANPLATLPALLGPLLTRLLAALLLLGLVDLLLARRRHQRALRMSRDEVRREQREEEGDPSHRGERRRRHRALLEAPPLAQATCLVVNPTHLAVALLHRRELDEPPRVVAKGAGADARRLRSQARRAGVPIVRDVPLARALHRLAEVGDEIPEPLYDAAAAVLAHLYGAPPAVSP